MAEKRKRIIELVTKVTGAPEMKRLETSLRKIDKSTAMANKRLAKMSKQTKSAAIGVKGLATSFGLLLGAGAMGGVLRATIEQEKAITQLNTVLESTGGVAGKTSEELQEMASALQAVTTYGDEAILGAQSMLLTFTKINGENFDRTVESVLNLSTAMGQDLKASVVQLGKALNDPVANLGALGRTGIQFSKEQKEVIKNLAETNRLAEAQAIILEELETQFGNSARAARQTLGGALKGLNNAFGDLLEAENREGAKELTAAVNELSDLFTDPEFKKSVQDIASAMLELAGTGIQTFTNFTNIVGYLKDELLAMYGVVDQNDIARLLEKQADLTERINRGGVAGFLQNTTELKRQLEEVNRQLDAAYARVNKRNAAAASGPAPTPAAAPVATIAAATGESPAKVVNDTNKAYEEQYRIWARLNPEISAYAEQMMLLNQQLAQGSIDQDRYNVEVLKTEAALNGTTSAMANMIRTTTDLTTANNDIEESMSFLDEAAATFESTFATAFDGVAMGTQDVSQAFESMAKSIISQLLKIAAYKAIAGFTGGTFGGYSAFADGGVVSGGNKIQAFASGGVVNGPTTFGMSRGRTGIAGEAGPELIAPIQRMPNGDMGVGASPVNVTVNNMAAGVETVARQDSNGGLTIDVVLKQAAQAIQSGGNVFADSLEKSYSLNRGRSTY